MKSTKIKHMSNKHEITSVLELCSSNLILLMKYLTVLAYRNVKISMTLLFLAVFVATFVNSTGGASILFYFECVLLISEKGQIF